MDSRIQAALLTACALSLSAQEAIAQGNYPQKPVRFIIPFAPGGAGDFVGRIVALKLADLLGQPMVVDNRPGASGFLGLEIGASAKPDGYTMVLGNNGAVVSVPRFTPRPLSGPRATSRRLRRSWMFPVRSSSTLPCP